MDERNNRQVITPGETEENPQQISGFLVEITATLSGRTTNHGMMFLPLNATPQSRQDVILTLVSVGIALQYGAEALANDILDFCARRAVGVQAYGLVLHVHAQVSACNHDGAGYIAHLDYLEELYNAEDIEEDREYLEYLRWLSTHANAAASAEELKRVRIGEEERTCSICLTDFPVGSEATQLPCLHHFHGDCISTWLKESKTCPYCRSKLP